MPIEVNSQLIENLATHFQRRWKPNFAHVNAISLISMLPGLRAFWPMSANIHTPSIVDVACNYHLTMANNPKYGLSGLSTYMDFDGANQYAYYADDAQFDITGAEAYFFNPGLTLGGWFYLDSIAAADHPLITKWQTANQYSYQLNVSTAQPRFFVTTDGSTAVGVGSVGSVTTTRWYFLVGRFVPSTSVTVWFNNVKTDLAVGIPASIFNGTSQLEVGRIYGSGYLDGKASLCFVCASALPDVIINHIYQQSRALFGVR